MKTSYKLFSLAAVAALAFAVAGCKEKDPMEKAADSIKDAASDAADGVKDAADKTADAAKDAAKKVEDAVKK